MSYAQRFIIGLVIIISAYSLLYNAEERYTFHKAINMLSKTLGTCLGCYPCVEIYRKAAVILIFTAGTSLVFDFGVTIALLSQLIVIALEFVEASNGAHLGDLKWMLMNVVLFIILLKNWGCCSCADNSNQVEVKKDNKKADTEKKLVEQDPAHSGKGKPGKNQKYQKK